MAEQEGSTRMGDNKDRVPERLPREAEETELTGAGRRGAEIFLGAINVVLSGVPYVGQAFSELRSYQAQRYWERRLGTLARELTSRLECIRAEAVNWEYLKSEVFTTWCVNRRRLPY